MVGCHLKTKIKTSLCLRGNAGRMAHVRPLRTHRGPGGFPKERGFSQQDGKRPPPPVSIKVNIPEGCWNMSPDCCGLLRGQADSAERGLCVRRGEDEEGARL